MRARATVALFLVIPAAFAYACGGDDTSDAGGDSGENDGTVANDTGSNKDGTTTNDSGGGDTGTSNDGGTTDSGSTDSGSQDSGSKDSGSADSGSFTCTKPSDCPNEFCCGTIIFNGGQLPNCKLADASSACSATCNSNVQLSCNATDTVRSCAQTSDCADAGSNYNKCCTVPFSDASVTFCWNSTYAGLVGGTCM